MSVTGVIGISSPEIGRYTQFYTDITKVDRPKGTATAHVTGACISSNRNKIIDQALENGAEWIWFVDDDHRFPPDTLNRLLARHVDIVSGLYLQRIAPYTPHRYHREEANGAFWPKLLTQGESGLDEVQATGAGCLLVKTTVFEKLTRPYWRLGQMNPDVWGDDFDFCRRARAVGLKIWCDLDVLVGHYVVHCVYPARNAEGHWSTRLTEGEVHIASFPTATTVPVEGEHYL